VDTAAECEDDIPSRRSLDSTATSTAGTDFDDDDSDDVHRGIDASAYGSRHKALEVALKSKTKHLLSLVKMDGILATSPGRRGLGRRMSMKRKGQGQAQDMDNSSRRTSMSSMRSMPDEEERSHAEPVDIPPRAPGLSPVVGSASPPQPLMRRITLRRTVSGKTVKDESRSGGEGPEADAVDWDSSIDVREGVYDSSKKQRVPSWVSVLRRRG
jgi:hypothetical protein